MIIILLNRKSNNYKKIIQKKFNEIYKKNSKKFFNLVLNLINKIKIELNIIINKYNKLIQK